MNDTTTQTAEERAMDYVIRHGHTYADYELLWSHVEGDATVVCYAMEFDREGYGRYRQERIAIFHGAVRRTDLIMEGPND